MLREIRVQVSDQAWVTGVVAGFDKPGMHEPQDQARLQGLDVFAKGRQLGKRSRSREAEVRGPRVCVAQDANQAFPWIQAITQGEGLAHHRDVDGATCDQARRIVETIGVGLIDEMKPAFIALDDRGVAGMGKRVKPLGQVRPHHRQLRPGAAECRAARRSLRCASARRSARWCANRTGYPSFSAASSANCTGIFRVWSPKHDARFDHHEACREHHQLEEECVVTVESAARTAATANAVAPAHRINTEMKTIAGGYFCDHSAVAGHTRRRCQGLRSREEAPATQ